MASKTSIKQLNMLRDFSSAFSRGAFTDIIKYEDYSYLNWLHAEYGSNKNEIVTYGEYLKSLYSEMLKNYRCEYVYKNELICHIRSEWNDKYYEIYNFLTNYSMNKM